MKRYVIQADITIKDGDKTLENIRILASNIMLSQFDFIDKSSLTVIDPTVDMLFVDFQKNNMATWLLRANEGYIEVELNPSSIKLNILEKKDRAFNISYYIALLLNICDNMLIWQFQAQEVIGD